MKKLIIAGTILFACLGFALPADAGLRCTTLRYSSVVYSVAWSPGQWHRAVGIYSSGEPEYGRWTTNSVARAYPDPGRSFTGGRCETW